MATVQDRIDQIEAGGDYVPQSLIVKSYDYRGVTLKWVDYADPPANTIATRKELFIWTSLSDSDKPMEDREEVGEVMLDEAY